MRAAPEISAIAPDSPDALATIGLLDAELLQRYPGEAVHGLHPDEVAQFSGVFLLARVQGRAVACGAFRPLESRVVEIKRMYVVPEYRGQGVARLILTRLEEEARTRGFAIARLETGTRQPEAIGLYEASGYLPIPKFGEYVGNPYSVCYEKRLR